MSSNKYKSITDILQEFPSTYFSGYQLSSNNCSREWVKLCGNRLGHSPVFLRTNFRQS
jgi:hypothetical protein